MVELLLQYEESGAHRWVVKAFEKAIKDRGGTDTAIDMLQFMKEHGMVQPYRHHIVGHLVLGLTSDMLHFIYEAMRCFEKRKFAVGFAMLRKPLKENLLFLSWLLADQDDFVRRFESNTHVTLNRVLPDRRLSIIQGAISRLATSEAFSADVLHEIIFSKNNPRSFEPVWQRASHLITSQGELLKTEDLNINFIFQDPESDDLFELLYQNLPYVLLYAIQVSLECFSCILKYNEQTVSHLIISTMGCYETLLGTERSISRMLSRHLRSFLSCPHCDARLRLTRQNSIEMYLREQLHCYKCSLTSPFPLYWLLTKAKVTITRQNGGGPLIDLTTEEAWATQGEA